MVTCLTNYIQKIWKMIYITHIILTHQIGLKGKYYEEFKKRFIISIQKNFFFNFFFIYLKGNPNTLKIGPTIISWFLFYFILFIHLLIAQANLFMIQNFFFLVFPVFSNSLFSSSIFDFFK